VSDERRSDVTDNNSNLRLISADAHVIEPPHLFEQHLPASLRGRAPRFATTGDGDAWEIDGVGRVALPPSAATGSGYRPARSDGGAIAFSDVLPGLYDGAERLKLQDADSVDAEVIYPSPGLWDAIKQLDDTELQVACVRAYNDWIASFCATSPNRLIGVGKIPSSNLGDALDELERCLSLGLKGVVLDAWPGGSRDEPEAADAFWSVVDGRHAPVSIHYGLGRESVTAPPSGIAAGLNPPLADIGAASLAPLLATGVLDRYPNVRMVLAHANAGWAVHWLEFMDNLYIRGRHLESRKLPFADAEAVPSEYIRRHFWFTFHQDRSAIRTRHLLGASHLLWGSHFPLDATNWPDNREQAMRVTEELPTEDRQKVLGENVARLYRLPGYEAGFEDGAVNEFEQLVHL
jgi:predicted TIM-barrel fold metal-dependent hydrolase